MGIVVVMQNDRMRCRGQHAAIYDRLPRDCAWSCDAVNSPDGHRRAVLSDKDERAVLNSRWASADDEDVYALLGHGGCSGMIGLKGL